MATQKVIKQFVTEAPVVKDDGTMVFRCSDATPDRVGDRVFSAGIRLERYQANPVLLWDHNTSIPAIGTGKVWVENDALWMTPTFSSTNPLAAQIKAQVEAGEIRAISIGFIPLEGKPNATGGYDFTAAELFEISLVNVPCHPGALREKSMTDDQFNALVEQLTALATKVDALGQALTEMGQTEAEETKAEEEPVEAAPEAAPTDAPAEEDKESTEDEELKAFYALFRN